MSFAPVKLGVVGLGNFGMLHARTAARLAEAELVAVVDPRRERIESATRLAPGVRGWGNLSHAIRESDAQAWVVAASTDAHVPLTHELLAAGKIVLVEKPLATSLAKAESLRPLVKPDSSNLMLAHIMLFNSEFAQLRGEAERRGSIRYLNSVRHRPATMLDLLPGESPLHLLLVHDLYLTQVLLDRAEPSAFSCRLSRTARGVDLAVAQLVWPSGAVAGFSASFLTPEGMPPDGFDRLEVFGEGWAGRIDSNPRPIRIWDQRARWPLALDIRADDTSATGMLAEELRCFCRVVREKQPVPIGATYEDAIQLQRWLDRLEAATC